MTSGVLLGIVLSVCDCWFHDMVTLPSLLVPTDFGTCSYQCFLANFTPLLLLLFSYIIRCLYKLHFVIKHILITRVLALTPLGDSALFVSTR
jgi:hypothetical protein